ncbi:zinc finger matrin-type protein CG9776 isoform X1 [Pieris rapae]|uniref:zinc finger matrin-type protein CG9776 isoform X1 n=1 Tax=Pieris rapae TaxID=64459 RepID=UPI001E2810F4|nr:zinc finger matrin-type protein CG9776 isoform X1 [Pieris rapae]
MSRDMGRKDFYTRDRNWESYRRYEKSRPMKRSHSPLRDKRSSSPHRTKKDIDDNLMNSKSKSHEVWDNHRQDFSIPPPASFSTQDGPAYNQSYQPSYSGIYDEFSSAPPHSNNEMSSWNQMSLPPPPPAPQVYNVEDQIKKEAAIESEMRHQKAALSKQREDYIKKASILKKELDTLKDQRSELRGDSKRSPSPDTKRFLKENTKLQLEIQNKLKTINNVVDMLNGIIGEEAANINDSDGSPDRNSKRKSRSPSVGNKCNYVYYDPEMHWCRVCNDFPPTAKDYLNHLHSVAHHKSAAAHMEAPWHSLTGMHEGFPNYPSAPTKRTPIKGLQFFVPSTAWYCKLCDQFIGDLHCASAHLKSVVHAKNYTNFVEQNPHWETDWMSDRQKAFEKSRDTKKSKEDKGQYTAHTITFSKDGFHTKNKTPERELDKKRKDKKRKKNRKRSSSSSSSQTTSSDSDSEPVKKKKNRKEKEKMKESRAKDWISHNEERHHDSERKIIENIKRIKMEHMESLSRRGERNARERERSPPREGDRDRSKYDSSREMRRSDSREERRLVESHRRDDRHDDRRDERLDDRREIKREERREEKRDRRDDRRNSQPREVKKPEIKKMPFIGKMPVYKHLGKPKTEEIKKEDEKKIDGEAIRKKQQEMDIEIQKKVAEFKEKIAKSQLERSQAEAQQQLMSGLLNPYLVGAPISAAPVVPPCPPAPIITMPTPTPQIVPSNHQGAQPPNLPKDFQDALDIIFPSDVKPDMKQQELFQGMNQQIPGFGGMGMVPQFQQISLLGQTPMMVPFEMNASMYPRQQLYDTHVPILPKNQINDKRQQNQEENEKKMERNKEELDELAMLGIDASDVGAGM